MEKKPTSYNNSIQTTGYLISHIHWLNKIRKTTNEPDIIKGINISISILLCTYIESILNELLESIIEKRIKETNDTSYKRVLETIQMKLTKASWNQYLDISKTILPKTLNYYVDNETWKGIKILFSLRNVIVHGKEIKAKLLFQDDNYKIEYSGIYEKILDYFKEQKVLKSHQLRSSGHKILSIQSTNHFIKITDKFIDKIIIKILEEQGVSHGEIFSYRFNILGNHGIDYEEIYPKSQNTKMNDDDLPF
ncbi:hypothetical protein [Marivirga atlantica]|uniref:RiboL-PSP-HEPN domain-containing protein n=1 Tax=Marivirga atlantica TaxID=1548457 RepID=A0A937DKW9_9BACT|nr:hypothetical protein [Marivirga atlantica]MBL0766489.1 hypothetical protein [Marivirga atlantica]